MKFDFYKKKLRLRRNQRKWIETIQLVVELESSLFPYKAWNICGYTQRVESNVYTRNYFIPIVHIYVSLTCFPASR